MLFSGTVFKIGTVNGTVDGIRNATRNKFTFLTLRVIVNNGLK